MDLKAKVLKHSSIKIEDDVICYVDPYLIEEETHDADYILITHPHHDHFSLKDIQKVAKKDTKYVFPYSMKDQISGVNYVILLKPYDEFSYKKIKIKALHSYNNITKEFHPFWEFWLGYRIEINGVSYAVLGDSDYNEDINKVLCDVLFVPVGGKYTMDYIEAAQLTNEIKPKIVIPTHYGLITGTKDDGKNFEKLVSKDINVIIQI